MLRTLACFLTLLLVGSATAAGCSSGSGGDGDADGDADGDGDADVEVAPPEPPALPVLTPCPPGWREVPPADAEDVTTCDPWPEGGPEECVAEDEAHFPGEPGCRRVGAACPAAGGWAEGLPADSTVLYVRAGDPAGGTGSRDTPFGTIGEAMEIAEEGTIVALSAGRYDEVVSLRREVTLWGACVAETLVASSEPDLEAGTIIVAGPDTVVRNLRIAGNRWGLRASGSARSVDLEDVVVANSLEYGLWVAQGATLTGRNVVVRDTQPGFDGWLGRGLNVLAGTHGPAHVELDRVVFLRNRELGVFVAEVGTTLALTNAAIRDTLSRESDDTNGKGLSVQDGSNVEVAMAVLQGNRALSINIGFLEPTLRLTDVVVRDTRSQASDGWYGRGLNLSEGAAVVVERGLFERNLSSAIWIDGSTSTLQLTDVVVRDTGSREGDRMIGHGINILEGSELTVLRGLFQRNRETGILADGPGSMVTLTDVTVFDTAPQEADDAGGRAVGAQAGARLEITRGRFERNHMTGVVVIDEGTVAELTDLTIRDTESYPVNGQFGEGLSVQGGSSAVVTRALLENNREVGIVAEGATATLQLTDVVVADTRERACAADTCAGAPAGSGMLALNGANISATSFQVLRHPLAGVMIADGGTMDLEDGEVAHNFVGASVQTEEFDIDRLVDRVVYHHNERDFDSAYMPVPDPAFPDEL